MTLVHVCLDLCQWSLMSLITGNKVKNHTSQGIVKKKSTFFGPQNARFQKIPGGGGFYGPQVGPRPPGLIF